MTVGSYGYDGWIIWVWCWDQMGMIWWSPDHDAGVIWCVYGDLGIMMLVSYDVFVMIWWSWCWYHMVCLWWSGDHDAGIICVWCLYRMCMIHHWGKKRRYYYYYLPSTECFAVGIILCLCVLLRYRCYHVHEYQHYRYNGYLLHTFYNMVNRTTPYNVIKTKWLSYSI